RVRYRCTAHFLVTDNSLHWAVDHVPATEPSRATAALAGTSKSAYAPTTGGPFLFYLGNCGDRIFHVLNAARVLHATSNSGAGIAGRSVAGKRSCIARVRVSRLKNFVLGAVCDCCARIGSGNCAALFIETACT